MIVLIKRKRSRGIARVLGNTKKKIKSIKTEKEVGNIKTDKGVGKNGSDNGNPFNIQVTR